MNKEEMAKLYGWTLDEEGRFVYFHEWVEYGQLLFADDDDITIIPLSSVPIEEAYEEIDDMWNNPFSTTR